MHPPTVKEPTTGDQFAVKKRKDELKRQKTTNGRNRCIHVNFNGHLKTRGESSAIAIWNPLSVVIICFVKYVITVTLTQRPSAAN